MNCVILRIGEKKLLNFLKECSEKADSLFDMNRHNAREDILKWDQSMD